MCKTFSVIANLNFFAIEYGTRFIVSFFTLKNTLSWRIIIQTNSISKLTALTIVGIELALIYIFLILVNIIWIFLLNLATNGHILRSFESYTGGGLGYDNVIFILYYLLSLLLQCPILILAAILNLLVWFLFE